MDVRAKINTSRTMRLFNTELFDRGSECFSGNGKRLGIEIYSLSRILAMRKAWKELAQCIVDLDVTAPYPRFSRQSSYEEIRSKDWIFHEELGKLREGHIRVSDDIYFSVEDPTRKGWWISVMIDSNDFEDVRVTTYSPFKLETGEVIQEGDLRLKQPIHPTPMLREREPVPPEWIGQHFNEEVYGSLKRQPKTIVTSLIEVVG